MDEILKMLVTGKKVSLTLYILAGIFLGIQYAEFKYRLSRIEDRLSAVEARIASLESGPKKPNIAKIP